jgi:hypothetical protein
MRSAEPQLSSTFHDGLPFENRLPRHEAIMGRQTRGKAAHQLGIGPVEHELTMHLERAHELGERAARSNGAARVEIARAREIVEEITSCVRTSKTAR